MCRVCRVGAGGMCKQAGGRRPDASLTMTPSQRLTRFCPGNNGFPGNFAATRVYLAELGDAGGPGGSRRHLIISGKYGHSGQDPVGVPLIMPNLVSLRSRLNIPLGCPLSTVFMYPAVHNLPVPPGHLPFSLFSVCHLRSNHRVHAVLLLLMTKAPVRDRSRHQGQVLNKKATKEKKVIKKI